ncbi:hypothetical protein Slin14017_G049550 [Septoria linicola]|nr:hypothetical protein Slin14017_G049550 [Septoria linicola]
MRLKLQILEIAQINGVERLEAIYNHLASASIVSAGALQTHLATFSGRRME